MLRQSLRSLALVPGEKFIYKAEIPPRISGVILDNQRTAPPHPWVSKYKWSPEVAPVEEERQADPEVVTLFGGSGFLGQRVTKLLVEEPSIKRIRIGTRFPDEVEASFPEEWKEKVEAEYVDITDRHNVLAAAEGSQALVNMVGISYECELSMREAHVDSAHLISHAANVTWATRVVHLSSLAAEYEHDSLWSDSKFRGEDATIANFRQCTVLRCAPMVGKGSPQLKKLSGLISKLPFYPAFGSGYQVAPVSVDDVAKAVALSITTHTLRGHTIECTGPQDYSHKELVRELMRNGALPSRPILPVKNAAAGFALGVANSFLPNPTYTQDHLYTLHSGKQCVATGELNTLVNLGIEPTPIKEALELA